MEKEQTLHNRIKEILPEHESPMSDMEWKGTLEKSPHYQAVLAAMQDFADQQSMEVAKRQWVSVKERLPERGQLVLVYRDIESKQMYSTIWAEEDERFADWNDITHWMPLSYPIIEEVKTK